MKVNERPINPKVSVWTKDWFPKKGDELKQMDLYTVMKQCERISSSAEKGKSGSIFPYLSDEVNPYTLLFDGVVFVDIDNCQEVSHKIFDSFDKICGEIPNLLAMNFSYSKNIHCYFYDEDIKNDSSKYSERALLYLTAFAAVVKKVLGIDLRDIEGALDEHSKSPTQRLFLNHSTFKWNEHCCKALIKKDERNKLKAEYHSLFRIAESKRTVVETPLIKGEGKILVDSTFNLLGYGTGYEARTLIASAVYMHFEKDIERAREYLSSKFENAQEINIQMTSMINNGYIERKCREDIEKYLFGFSVNEEHILKPGQYLSEVIDIDKLEGRYYYIQSNTGSGKTEFVKKYLKDKEGEVFFVQMTKALRDGKKQTIENFTFENWEYGLDKSLTKFHMSLDGVIKQLRERSSKLHQYTIIVDESHLLEDYINIREIVINEFLTLLKRAGKVVFMSATPKSDIKLFPFEKVCFTRIQEQDLVIHLHPLKLFGEGSKDRAKYEFVTRWIKQRNNKVIVFSNKKQEAWKKYGLNCEGVTYFNSNNYNDDGVQAILKENKLINHITLSTIYMGCGVEVKHEKEVDVVFFLNEGFDDSTIIQSIGRPRCSGGVEKVNVHFFYTTDCSFKGYHTKEDAVFLQNAFDNLVVHENHGTLINVLAAHMTGIRASSFNEWESKNEVKLLKVSQLMRNISYFNPSSVSVLKHLPYRSIEIKYEDIVDLDRKGEKSIIRSEKKLLFYLCSLSRTKVSHLVNEDGYEALLDSGNIPYDDKKNAREEIRRAVYIAQHGIEISEALHFFGTLKRAVKHIKALDIRISLDIKQETLKRFEGDGSIYDKFLREFEANELIFTDEYKKHRLELLQGKVQNIDVTSDFLNAEHEEVFLEFLGINKDELNSDNEDVKIPVFRGTTFRNCVSVNKSRSIGGSVGSKEGKKKGGQKGGSKTFSVKIQKVDTGEIISFESKTECMNYLGWSSKKFSEFMKNKRDKKNTYVVLDSE